MRNARKRKSSRLQNQTESCRLVRGVEEFGSVNTSRSIVPKWKKFRVGCDVVVDVIPARTVIAVDRGRRSKE